MMRKMSLLIVLFLAVAASGMACCTTLSETGLVIGNNAGTPTSPNPVATNNLSVYNGTGANLTNLYLVIGLPSTAANSAPSTTPSSTKAACGSTFTGSDSNPFDNCSALQAPSVATSDTFTAWHNADTALGINATYFNLYSYTFGSLNNGSALSISFSSALPVGTIEAAYGSTGSALCYVTSYTNTGQVTPEPASLMMVGGAFLALLGRRLWKQKS